MGSAWPKIGGAAFNGLVSGISSQITQDLQKPHKHGKDKEENQKKTPEKDEEVLHNGSPMHASDVPPDRVVHNGIGEMVQLANVTVTSLGIEDVEVVKAGDLLRVASAATNSAAASEMSEPDGADQSSNAVDILSILAITENSDDRENVTLAHLSNDTNFTALNASGVQTLRTRSSQAILIPSGEMQGVHGATSQVSLCFNPTVLDDMLMEK